MILIFTVSIKNCAFILWFIYSSCRIACVNQLSSVHIFTGRISVCARRTTSKWWTGIAILAAWLSYIMCNSKIFLNVWSQEKLRNKKNSHCWSSRQLMGTGSTRASKKCARQGRRVFHTDPPKPLQKLQKRESVLSSSFFCFCFSSLYVR